MSDDKKNKIIGNIITLISVFIIAVFVYDKITYDFIEEYYSLTTIDSYNDFKNNRYIKNSNSFTTVPDYYHGCSRVSFEIISQQEYNDDYIKVDYIVKTDMYKVYTCSDLWQIKGNKVLRKNTLYMLSDV